MTHATGGTGGAEHSVLVAQRESSAGQRDTAPTAPRGGSEDSKRAARSAVDDGGGETRVAIEAGQGAVETGLGSVAEQHVCENTRPVVADTVPGYKYPATQNTSPLALKVEAWDARLRAVHKHVCTDPHCLGIRTLTEVLRCDPLQPMPKHEDGCLQCFQATEAELLLHGIHYGFYVMAPHTTAADIPPFAVDNYARAPAEQAALREKIKAELANGLLQELDHPPRHLTALFTKQEVDKVRPLRDYSAPKGNSINDHADAGPFKMMSLEDGYALMTPGCWLAKADVEAAFRTVGVHHKHWDVLAFQHDDAAGKRRYYRDTRFPFGLKCSPEVFCRLSHAVRAMMAAMGIPAIVVYVDDFLVVAATEQACQAALDALLSLLAELGFTVSPKKTVLPCQSLTFLGLLLESNCDGQGRMQVSVPLDKLEKARDIATTLCHRHRIACKELQRALGYFNHLAQAVFSARVYMRRLIEALRNATTPTILVTADIRYDLLWWANHTRAHNGTAVLLQEPRMQTGFFATDASDWGMGGVLGEECFSVAWTDVPGAIAELIPRDLRKYLKAKYRPDKAKPGTWWIDYREQFAMFFALLMWRDRLVGRHAALHCDNVVAEHTLNKGSAFNLMMHALIRRMYRYMAAENVRARVFRITTHANVLADALSRGDMLGYLRAAALWKVPPPAEVWSARVFKNPPLLEQAAIRFRAQSLPVLVGQAGDGAVRTTAQPHNITLDMEAEVPALDSEEYHTLYNAEY